MFIFPVVDEFDVRLEIGGHDKGLVAPGKDDKWTHFANSEGKVIKFHSSHYAALHTGAATCFGMEKKCTTAYRDSDDIMLRNCPDMAH